MCKFILLSGKAGSGKDTVAKILKENYEFKDFRYADRLKKILLDAGWDGKKDLRGRKLLQKVGKAFRDWDENFWVDKLLYDVTEAVDNGYKKICVADVRHDNELFYFIDQMKKIEPASRFLYVKIYGRDNLDEVREMDQDTLTDISETGVDHLKADYYLYNTIQDNFEYISLQVKKMIESVFSD